MLSTFATMKLGGDLVLKSPIALFQAFECIYQPSWYRLVTLTQGALDKLNKAAYDGGKTLVQMSWGGVEAGQSVESNTKTLRLRELMIQPMGGVMRLGALAVDRQTDLATCGQRFFKQRTASEIIEEIAKSHGLGASVQPTQTRYTLHQCTQSDLAFLQDVVLPRTGPEPHILYFRDGNELVFAKRIRQRQAGESTPLFRYGTDASLEAGDEVTSVNVTTYVSRMLVDHTNYPTSMVAFDATKRQGNPYVKTYIASDETYQYDPFADKRPVVLGKTPTSIVPVIVDSGLSVDAEIKARSSWKAPFTTMRIAATCQPLPKLALGGLASFQASGASKSAARTFLHGDYLIYGLYHEIDPRRRVAETTVFLERRGMTGA